MGRMTRVLLVATAAALAGALGAAGTAYAHVTVTPEAVPQVGDATVAFQVPCESDTAATVTVDMQFPTDHPVAAVALLPVPGWTARAVTGKLPAPITTDDGTVTEAVTEVVWTANSATTGIQPGQFGQFTVLLGGLPKVDRLVFKTVQTYADGTVTSWIEVPVPGAAEPEHPAPVLRLTAGTADAAVPTGAAPAATATRTSPVPLVVAVIAAVLGLAGLLLGAAGYARTRPVPPAGGTTPAG